MSRFSRPNVATSGIGHLPESEALRKLQSGEITLGEYLDYHADLAVEHLKGLIDADRLQMIRGILREQMTTDPVLIEHLRRATGLSLEPHQAS